MHRRFAITPDSPLAESELDAVSVGSSETSLSDFELDPEVSVDIVDSLGETSKSALSAQAVVESIAAAQKAVAGELKTISGTNAKNSRDFHPLRSAADGKALGELMSRGSIYGAMKATFDFLTAENSTPEKQLGVLVAELNASHQAKGPVADKIDQQLLLVSFAVEASLALKSLKQAGRLPEGANDNLLQTYDLKELGKKRSPLEDLTPMFFGAKPTISVEAQQRLTRAFAAGKMRFVTDDVDASGTRIAQKGLPAPKNGGWFTHFEAYRELRNLQRNLPGCVAAEKGAGSFSLSDSESVIVLPMTFGETEREIIQAKLDKSKDGRGVLEEVLPDLVRNLGTNLDSLHARGFVHGDVVLANLLKGAVLCDLGTLHHVDDMVYVLRNEHLLPGATYPAPESFGSQRASGVETDRANVAMLPVAVLDIFKGDTEPKFGYAGKEPSYAASLKRGGEIADKYFKGSSVRPLLDAALRSGFEKSGVDALLA